MATRTPPLLAPGGRHGQERLSQEVVEEHQRAHLIAVVAELVCREGTPPSGEAIVAEARVSRMSIYRLFGSKGGLIDAACVAATELLAEPVREAGGSDGPWLARLDAGLGGLLDAAAADPLMAELCVVHSPRLLAPLTAGPDTLRSALVRLLAGGREAGHANQGAGYKEPAPDTEVFVAAGMIAMLEHRLRNGGVEASAERRAEMVQLATEQFIPWRAGDAAHLVVLGRPPSGHALVCAPLAHLPAS